MKVLDSTGLSKVWTKIKSTFFFKPTNDSVASAGSILSKTVDGSVWKESDAILFTSGAWTLTGQPYLITVPVWFDYDRQKNNISVLETRDESPVSIKTEVAEQVMVYMNYFIDPIKNLIHFNIRTELCADNNLSNLMQLGLDLQAKQFGCYAYVYGPSGNIPMMDGLFKIEDAKLNMFYPTDFPKDTFITFPINGDCKVSGRYTKDRLFYNFDFNLSCRFDECAIDGSLIKSIFDVEDATVEEILALVHKKHVENPLQGIVLTLSNDDYLNFNHPKVL